MRCGFQRFGMVAAMAAGLWLSACRPPPAEVAPEEPAAPTHVPPEQVRMTQSDSQGQIALADYRGKTLLVYFFAAASEECRAEIPALNKLLGDYQGRSVAVLGVAMDMKPGIYVAADLRGVNAAPAFPYVLGGKAARQAFPAVRVLPTKWLLNSSGQVVNRFEGAVPFDEVRAAIDRLAP